MTRRPRLIAGVLLALVFLTGSMIGMAVEEGFGLDWFDFLDEDEGSRDAGFLSGLDLDEGQQRKVDRILDQREETLEEYWESRLPELREILAASDDSIRAVLGPQQRERFDSYIASGGARIPDGPD